MVKIPVIRTVIGMVGSKVEISFIGKHKPAGKGPQPQLSTPVKSVFQVKHYGLKKRQKCKPVCTICRKEQAEHWKCKHTNKDGYKCNECNKEFGWASNYKKHMLLHQEEKKKIVCDECGCFSYPSQLKSHLEVHSPRKIHKCPTRGCGKTFKCSQTLKCHMEKHNRKEYKFLKGPHVTDLPHYWRDHMTRNHGPVLVCEYYINGCEYTTHHRLSLSQHETWCEYKPSTSSSESEDDNN